MRIVLFGIVFLSILYGGIAFGFTPITLPSSAKFTVIHIGNQSHRYIKHIPLNSTKSLRDLPLKTDAVNYVSVSYKKNSSTFFSKEIVIVWSGTKKDTDKDGLSDEMEKELGTDKTKLDSDSDGIPDGEEFATWGGKKRSLLDFDEDGLPNIIDRDSDNDGIPDGKDPEIERLQPLSFFVVDKQKTNLSTVVYFATNKKPSGRTISAKFSWRKNKEPFLAGYIIYYGIESKKYTRSIDIGMGNSVSSVRAGATVIIETINNACKYYFAITAYDVYGAESDPSSEIVFTDDNCK